MRKLMTGKVKEVYAVDDDTLEFAYTDHISVFDKIIPSMVPHKGETLCRTAKYWFNILSENGISNHYLSEPARDRMDVKRVRVIRDYSEIDRETADYLIPLEIICRHYVAGSLMDRVRTGEITAEQLGFPEGHEVRYGEKLPRPFVEATTKLEATDRNLTDAEAKEMAGLTDAEYDEIVDTTLRIDEIIAEEAAKRGLIHCDGKKEYGYDKQRKLMVVDTFGTLDEDRWWDAEEYARGNIVELSKEFVRQYYRETGYHKALCDAREKGLPEPDIPALPQDVIDRTSKLYVDMYERITGERFRTPTFVGTPQRGPGLRTPSEAYPAND
ncbi:phosphoribosylaminoimidazolesuccinocarboxamide synthase [Methanomassiliicoccaceae archaeon COG_1]|nr:phosphoribosylaminoimidazolesuccinocarboxamide synthase [Methanomassiliicoccaceae archaeon COG_1]